MTAPSGTPGRHRPVDSVREHASRGGFPADSVEQVRRRIDPTTGGR